MDAGTSRIDFSLDSFSDGAQSQSISFETLINLRRAHQTRQAATGSRKSVIQASTQAESEDPKIALSKKKLESQRSEKQRLLKQFNEVLKAHEERNTSTGADRKQRWQGAPAAGNAANAAKAAAERTSKVFRFCDHASAQRTNLAYEGKEKACQCLQEV